MANLKLGKLPDRTPAKITITVGADLNQALRDYAALYRATYGEAESVAELIPFMLEAFLDSDRAFAKARKDGLPETDTDKPARRARSARAGDTEAASPAVSSTSQFEE
ncbi:DUF2274 domain-containing protein [Stappia sp. F7233]|uniref:DUF2274 domain-containing protein n=1 Tax=Stappia albiluteola TaxID=2758565 RepID=A0A839A970_9HYPH|nr:DUF2274 domain-containing protein [Stappia albiluteola]MBA5775608.1 DUF2274 domain-containing protein [Stappia albiluteola]